VAIDLDDFGPIDEDPPAGAAHRLTVCRDRVAVASQSDRAMRSRPRGDEFGGFFAGPSTAESAVRLGDRLLKEICRHRVTSAGIVKVGASIGLVIVVPAPDLPDNAELMRIADRTMQAVKREAGACVGSRLRRPGRWPEGTGAAHLTDFR
jgi:GGDEF domain-containing protein